jgi:hypothetical protein
MELHEISDADDPSNAFWQAIKSHGKTLVELNIENDAVALNAWIGIRLASDLDILRDLCIALPQLEQLAINSARFESQNVFQDFLVAIKRLSNLISLKLVTRAPMSDQYEYRMWKTANNVFSALAANVHFTSLMLIARDEHDSDEDRTQAYMRQVAEGPWGNKMVQAYPVSLSRVQAEEPAAGIFKEIDY